MQEGTRVIVTWGVLGTVRGKILDLVTDGFDYTVFLDSGYTVGVMAGSVQPETQTWILVRVPSDLSTQAFNEIEDALLRSDIHFSMELGLDNPAYSN